MKTWLKRTLIGLFGAAVLFGGVAACSHHGRGFAGMSDADVAKAKARMVDKVSGKLDLDSAQQAKLNALADALNAQRLALVGGGQHPKAELQSMITGPTFDRARAKSLVDSKTGAITAQSPQVIAAMADFYDSLKPEQQAKVREFMARRARHS
jgi:periplasmic protein CpxP/Spy